PHRLRAAAAGAAARLAGRATSGRRPKAGRATGATPIWAAAVTASDSRTSAGPGRRRAIGPAGGATADADTSSLNLAAKIADGQKLVVPLRKAPGETVASAPPAASAPAPPAQTGATINVNTASQKILESLPGVGPVTATRIITRRTSTGAFTQIEQLRDEKLVNASTYERIMTLISVD